MGKVADLKFTASLVCIQALLDFAEETSKCKRKQMIGYFATGCYSAVSENVLKRLISHYPSHLTNQILDALVPLHIRELKLNKCTSVSLSGLQKVIQKCQHLSMLDLTECDQFGVPVLFTQIIAKNIQLTALSLESCLQVNDKVVKTLLKHIPSLQHLNISSCDITDRAFLINEKLQLGRELCDNVKEKLDEHYECGLVSIDISGCRNISSTAVRHLCTLCGPTLKNVNIAWTGADCMSLLYLSGYNLPDVVHLYLSLHPGKTPKFPTELEECLEELHSTLEELNQNSKSLRKNFDDKDSCHVESEESNENYMSPVGIDEIDVTVSHRKTENLKSKTEAAKEKVINGKENVQAFSESDFEIKSSDTECLKTDTCKCFHESNIVVNENDPSYDGACKLSQNISCLHEKQNNESQSQKTELNSDGQCQKQTCDTNFISCDNEENRSSSVNTCDIFQNKSLSHLKSTDYESDIYCSDCIKSHETNSSIDTYPSGARFKETLSLNMDRLQSNCPVKDGCDMNNLNPYSSSKTQNSCSAEAVFEKEKCSYLNQNAMLVSNMERESSDITLHEKEQNLSIGNVNQDLAESIEKNITGTVEGSNPEELNAPFDALSIDPPSKTQISSTENPSKLGNSEKGGPTKGKLDYLLKSCFSKKENSSSNGENVSVTRMFQPSLMSIDLSSIQFIDEFIGQECLKMFIKSNLSLQKFCISWKYFTDQILGFLASNLTELREITLVDCDGLTTVGISDLGSKCQNLRKVDLKGVYNIKNAAIYPYIKLPQLQSLCLAECAITDGTLLRIGARCSEKLKELDLSWCDDITERGINFLCSKFLKLQSLSLRHCPASTLTLSLLSENVKDLRYLNLCSIASIDDASVINLVENLQVLEIIDLSWNSGLEDRSITMLLRNCLHLKTAILSGLKRITSQPFLPIIAGLDRWRRCQKLIKFKLKEKEVLQQTGDLQLSSDEEFEDLYMPHRSTVYAPNLRVLDLEYCDRVTDQHLAEIVAVCRGSLQITDYYSEQVKPALFTR